MIIAERDGVVIVYLETLCTYEYFNLLLDTCSVALGVTFDHELVEDGIIEYEFQWNNEDFVVQYDAFLGITLYLAALETATEHQIQQLENLGSQICTQMVAIK